MRMVFLLLSALLLRAAATPAADGNGSFPAVDVGEPNPPAFPKNVVILQPGNDAANQKVIDYIYSLQGGQQYDKVEHQFVSTRFAILFAPGTHNVNVPVGFYTSVLGLGASPTDVVFNSEKGVYCEEAATEIHTGALDNFWREAANFHTFATATWNEQQGMLWATSQGASLRNVLVDKNLCLYEYLPVAGATLAGFASGGFMGNVGVAGNVLSGSQQQYVARNCAMKGWTQGVWNMNFVGSTGAAPDHCGKQSDKDIPAVTVDATPVIAEKPFITSLDGKFSLHIPKVEAGKRGIGLSADQVVDFAFVYVAVAGRDTADTINAKLQAGLHVLLTPGIYTLDKAIVVPKANQVLLGIGYATLVAAAGQPAVIVGDVDGVRVAGLLLQAGAEESPSLLTVGLGNHPGSAQNPTVLSDVYARVCGPSKIGKAKTMVTINSGNVIGDNLWLWRADHTAEEAPGGLVYLGECPVEVGIVVNGDDVTMYGLAVEHTTTDMVQWNGERGRVFFYQSEFPYDVTAEYGQKNYVSYRVGATVQAHTAYGVGVYHYFRDYPVVVNTCISAPASLEGSFHSPLAVFLNGKGTALHILNNLGGETKRVKPNDATPVWLCPGTSSNETAPAHAKARANTTAQAPTAAPLMTVLV